MAGRAPPSWSSWSQGSWSASAWQGWQDGLGWQTQSAWHQPPPRPQLPPQPQQLPSQPPFGQATASGWQGPSQLQPQVGEASFSPWQRPPPGSQDGTKKVALYFGTFDPIHENHVGIARFALEHGYADQVFFVVNGDNAIKVDVSPWTTRQGLVQQRVALEKDERLKVLDLSHHERQDMGWGGRAKIFHRVKRQCDGHVQLFQIMGQDSFEKSVLRSDPEKGNGIYRKAAWKFLVFPRLSDANAAEPGDVEGAHRPAGDGTVEVPPALIGRTTVVSGYVDPVQLSSSSIRSSLRSQGHNLASSQLHPSLQSDAARLYGQADPGSGAHPSSSSNCAAGRGGGEGRGSSSSIAPPQTDRVFVHLLGGPGSGKSSLGAALGELGFRHISGGDIYRAAKAAGTGDVRGAHMDQVVAKVVGAVVHVVTSWPFDQRVSFDGFLPKQLKDFEEKLGPISLVALLECRAETMQQRLASREAREEDIQRSVGKRIDVYLSGKERSLREETLKSWENGRGLVHRLDANRPFAEVFADLKTLLAKVKPLTPTSASPPWTIDWEKVFAEMAATPEQSYDWRKNARDLRERAGSRAMKNFHNFVKSILIDWATQTLYPSLCAGAGGGGSAANPIAKPLAVLDVASGRGGDMLKFLQSASAVASAAGAGEGGFQVQYTGVDIAGEQVREAWRRLEAALCSKHRDSVCRSTLRNAKHFVADVCTTPLPDDTAWCHLVSIQFALHYSFKTEARAKNFLKHACERLCSGGLFLCITVDETQIAAMAESIGDGPGLCVDNGLCSVTFPDLEMARRIRQDQPGGESFGLRYHFALPGEGIDCDEFVVREQTLVKLLDELEIDLLASVPFSSLLGSDQGQGHGQGQPTSRSADALAAKLLAEIAKQSGNSKSKSNSKSNSSNSNNSNNNNSNNTNNNNNDASAGTGAAVTSTRIKCDIYDRLGLGMTEAEKQVSSLYKAYVGVRRSTTGTRPSVADTTEPAAPPGKGFHSKNTSKGAGRKGGTSISPGEIQALLEEARPQTLP